jgi:hypothetical protein
MPIIYPDLRLDYKVATLPLKLTDGGVEILGALTWAHGEELRRLGTRLSSLF